jgi:hypothetical protein
MWVVFYSWDYDNEDCQNWHESRFETAYEAEQFALSLTHDGVAVVRTFKEPFKR